MVSWRSIWCNSFCDVFVGIRWALSLWSDLSFYPWKLFEFLWSLICMITYNLVFLLRIFGLVRPTRSIFLAMGRGALWWVRSYGAWSQWQKGDRHVCIVAIKDNKTRSISAAINKCMSSTSCHRSYCITPFLHELNTLDACWIAVDVWSNSSRCRQESVY